MHFGFSYPCGLHFSCLTMIFVLGLGMVAMGDDKTAAEKTGADKGAANTKDIAAAAVEIAESVTDARVFRSEDGKTLPYRLLKPKDYDSKKKYPLVLFLHGAGERGDNNSAQMRNMVAAFWSQENREKYPCFVLIPQCPLNEKWVEVDWAADSHKQPEQISPSLAMTLQVLEKLQKEFSIDPHRLYVMGISMGGYGTWDLITRKPELFAAAVPVCGGGDEATASQITKLPIWVFHGGIDTVVKTIRSRNMVEAIRKAGGTPRYTEIPSCSHNSWDPAMATPELLPWLFAQKRND
jgi:predicted peptidase